MTHHEQAVAQGGSQKTLSAYVVGFLLCIVLTFISFALVETHLLPAMYLYISLMALAVIQLVVQSVCFLRLNTSTDEARWNLFPFLFTLLIIAILVSGTLWIMYNLNYNMYN